MDPLKTAKLHRFASGIMNELATGVRPEMKAAAFAQIAKALAMAGPGESKKNINAIENAAIQSVLEKAAVDPYAAESDLWGDGPLGEIAAAYIASIAEESILDTLIMGGARRLPVNVNHAIVASDWVADVVAEGAPKPVIANGLSAADAMSRKVAGLIVLSDELARETGTELFEQECRAAVGRMANQAVLDIVVDSNTSTAADLASAMEVAGPSTTYVVAAPAGLVAKWAVESNTGNLGVRGGELVPGVRVVAIDDATDTVVIPANRVAIRDYGVMLRAAEHADVEMRTDPAGGASAVVTNLWQANLRAVLAEREFLLGGDFSGVVVIEGEG